MTSIQRYIIATKFKFSSIYSCLSTYSFRFHKLSTVKIGIEIVNIHFCEHLYKKIKYQSSIKFFIRPVSYIMYTINVVELHVRLKTTYEQIFWEEN